MEDLPRIASEKEGYNFSVLRHDGFGPTRSSRRVHRGFIFAIMILAPLATVVVFLGWSGVSVGSSSPPDSCDTVVTGFQCQPTISHYWGQYSPYFTVPSDISTDVPDSCKVTFVQILSRHGARDPTASKTKTYNNTIKQVHANVKTFTGPYEFLANYSYTLGADQLTTFGQEQMVNSGTKFYHRYRLLAMSLEPFIRSSGENRVVESALNWTQGFHASKLADKSADVDSGYPYPVILQYEGDGFNNTLNHALCTEFENGTAGDIGNDAQEAWAKIFIPPIQARLNAGLPGANLSMDQTVDMMDLCPFNTVANDDGIISPFCALFTEAEWHSYGYYQTLGKYYGYSYGNPLGPTQGVGFVNELIARLTNTSVQDHTSTNHTLDDDPATFPLGRKLYADFSHDNDMTAIFSALGLYNNTLPLPNTTVVEASAAGGYSAAWTVPFAARAYIEKMQCQGHSGELIRVIVNDRVQPLSSCGGDALGRCSLSRFVSSLGFAKTGGQWEQCFV
ncbi:3-phytase A [Fonsecaea pedrosoi]|nr:3-phytase A [Fonsecaea pedrosoi]